MSEFNIEDLDEVIRTAESSLVQMLALQLQKSLRQIKNGEEWIKCSDRMPDDEQELIVYDAIRGKVQSGMIYFDGEFVDFNEYYYRVSSPTHWQSLPPPPAD